MDVFNLFAFKDYFLMPDNWAEYFVHVHKIVVRKKKPHYSFILSTEERWNKFYLCTAYLKKPVAAITILYRNTKVKVRSPDGDTEYFDIVAGLLQGDTLAPYLFIICLDYVLRTSIDQIKENGFELTRRKKAEDTPQQQLPTPTTPMT